ncbi:hypothetical protein PybrP1_002337 [[Pythium] brassicae (nom. inval.)]|nr:hypothetical protein PybrP1_002337 [[Pythium] brassicae (nom. inval.)]
MTIRKVPSFSTRHRSEQRHLLVELELDDSLILARNHGSRGDRDVRRRSDFGAPTNDPQFIARHSWEEDTEDLAFVSAPTRDARARPQSAKSRGSARPNSGVRSARMLGGGRSGHVQYNSQEKLLSPYRLKQKVLSSRQSPSPERENRRGSRGSRGSAAAPRDSPLSLLCDSFRASAQLRDQLVAQLKQELAADNDVTFTSYHDRHKPELLSLRTVKTLNKLRSLSLSMVEMHVHFQREILPARTEPTTAVVLADREMAAYLLQMSASDVDFISCYAPLLRIFDRNDVGIVRNPLVEGLSLDSSELLLCSCSHGPASSQPAPAYASALTGSSFPLFQLVLHKLETFAQFMGKHVPAWQVMPHDRVAAALLHLAEIETRANASRLLPAAKRKREAERTRELLVRQRRVQAAKEVQRFCREAVLRKRLARIEAENQRMLFKTQLATLKARQEDEKRRRVESRRRRGQAFRAQLKLSDLTSKWRQSERERSELQDHHERVLDQYQRVDAKQRQQLARLKITTFIDTCVLRRKIAVADADRELNTKQWRLVSLEKQALECAVGQLRAADKLQLRVLQKKLSRLEGEKVVICETHDLLVKSYEERVHRLRQHVAKTTVKSFIDTPRSANDELTRKWTLLKLFWAERSNKPRI